MPSDKNPSPPSDAEEAAFVAEFLAGYESDLAAGRRFDLAHYQSQYPEREKLLAAEWARLAAPEDEPLPERIAHYRIERELGRGGQGRVFLAHDERMERKVALKVLPDRGPFSTRQLARFRREAEVAARLDHPGICTVFDSGQAAGVTYIAMRYVKGRTLAEQLVAARGSRESHLEDRDAVFRLVHVIEKTARAVHAAHLAGIIHRDLKPANLMVSVGGEPVVLDFGLARDEHVPDGANLTLTDEIFGTPVYMSPEQLRGGSKLDRRTDVYSLGATLYEALSLHTPFESESRESLFHMILTEEPPPLARFNPDLPRDLCTVVATAMAKERDARYRSAEDFAEDLRRVREYLPIEATPVGPIARTWRWCQRNRTVAMMAVVLFVGMTITLTTTLSSLLDSRRANQQLQENFDDIVAGKESKKSKHLSELILLSWQKLYSADPKKAMPLLEEIFTLDPGNVEAIAARMWHESTDPRSALAWLDQHIDRLPTVDPELSWLRARFLKMLERDDEAALEFAKAGEVATPLRLFLRGVTRVKGFMGPISETDGRAAIALFRRAIARSDRPRFHFLHSILMTASYIEDRALMDEATADLQHHWPDSPATYDAIAQFYLPVDRERGIAALRWLVANTKAAVPYCGLGMDAQQRGELDEALSWYDRGIAVDSEFAATWWMRGSLRESRGEPGTARTDYLAAIDRDPGKSFYYASLMSLHAKNRAWNDARTDFRALTSKHAGVWLAWKALAEACTGDGDPAAAFTAYETAAELRPDDPTITRRLTELRAKLQRK